LYEHWLRPVLFKLKPEQAHALTLSLLKMVGSLPSVQRMVRRCFNAPPVPVEAFGLIFQNPVGLAAGYDKDGLGWRGLACLGFGHVEIGTVTPRPQPGNPRPRAFRLVDERGVINRMGLPGQGMDFVVRALQKPRPPGLVLGVNLGKNKDTPVEEAERDYLPLVECFAPLADYLAINVSSPNTAGLRRLQGRESLERLLTGLIGRRNSLASELGKSLPMLVKLSPDLDETELDDALEVILRVGADGVIATNTTLSREGVRSALGCETGGLSGAPLRSRSTWMVREINRRTNGMLPVIGVGGIMNAQDAEEKLQAGAVLIQVYTGLVYSGPCLVKGIVENLAR
jgi:dihydroorotate dehydrogenase